jgi:hypothetical protein
MRGCAMMTRRWLVWLPVIMVASLLYWTVALGLGGMSLVAVSALSGSEGAGAMGLSASSNETDSAPATSPRDGYEPIIVRLEESVEPEDVDDNPGCGLAQEQEREQEQEAAGASRDHSESSGTPAPGATGLPY